MHKRVFRSQPLAWQQPIYAPRSIGGLRSLAIAVVACGGAKAQLSESLAEGRQWDYDRLWTMSWMEEAVGAPNGPLRETHSVGACSAWSSMISRLVRTRDGQSKNSVFVDIEVQGAEPDLTRDRGSQQVAWVAFHGSEA